MAVELSNVEVSIIIVNWNTKDFLKNCVQSIQHETSVSHEIIIIDNCSSDGSIEMLRRNFRELTVIANRENKGFAGANNQGIKIAKGRYVLLLNPDTIILEGAIDKMISWISDKSDVGCLGCQVWENTTDIQRTCFADPKPTNLFIISSGLMHLAKWLPSLGHPWYKDWDRRSVRDVDVVSGMFMLVPRPVIDQVGVLDEAFFVYAEEADWCRRIRKAGWRCVFTPEARILHLDGGSKSTVQIKSRMHVQMQKSHLIYTRKHHGIVGHGAVKGMFILFAGLRIALFVIVRLVRSDDMTLARIRLAGAALRYHLMGREPVN